MILGYKLIDCLTGHSKLWAHVEAGFNPEGKVVWPGDVARLELASLLRQAEKFDFDRLPLEPDGEGWYVPGLTDVEREAWQLGLIPLPAPVVWYEYVIGESRTGVLIQDEGERGWLVRMADYQSDERGIFGYSFTNVVMRITRNVEHAFELAEFGNREFFYWLTDRIARGGKNGEAARQVLDNGIKPMPGLALYLTLMLMSRSTEVRKEPITPAEKLANQIRRRGHRPEIKEHTVVTIVPKQFITRGDGQGGTHASPRLHWRRSHIRHYDHRTPGSVWQAEHEYNGRKGWWLAVIPRFLVGKRELGEITHDYMVKT